MKEAMDEQMKELIAIGASIGAHCQPCLTYHFNKARELGVEVDLIREAMDVGHMVEKGAMSVMQEFAKGFVGIQRQGNEACCAGKVSKNGKKCCG